MASSSGGDMSRDDSGDDEETGPSTKATEGDTLRVSFCPIVDRVRTDDCGERREGTDWRAVVAWGAWRSAAGITCRKVLWS